MFRFECQCRFRIHIGIDTRCGVSPALFSACTPDDCRGKRRQKEGRCCCRMLPGFIVRTLNFDGIKLSICVLTYERHEVASGKRQLATAQASHVSHQALPLHLPPPSSLVIEPEAVNEAQNLKWKRIYPADWPGLLALLPTRLVSIDFAFWCAPFHASAFPNPSSFASALSLSPHLCYSPIAVVLKLSLSVTNFIIIPNWVSLSIPQSDHPTPYHPLPSPPLQLVNVNAITCQPNYTKTENFGRKWKREQKKKNRKNTKNNKSENENEEATRRRRK